MASARRAGPLGWISDGDTVSLYLDVAETGNPASGIASVIASTNVPGYGPMTFTMTAGNWTVRGQQFNYRSDPVAISAGFPAQVLTVNAAATDNAGNSTSRDFAVTVDDTGPTGTAINSTNKAGGTAGRAEQGDTITYTFNEAMDPESFITGWDGSARNVTPYINSATTTGGDTVTIPAIGALGTVTLGNTGYVTRTRAFTNSTMTMTGNTITVVLGTPSGATGTVFTAGDMRWTPSAAASDLGHVHGAGLELGNDVEF